MVGVITTGVRKMRFASFQMNVKKKERDVMLRHSKYVGKGLYAHASSASA